MCPVVPDEGCVPAQGRQIESAAEHRRTKAVLRSMAPAAGTEGMLHTVVRNAGQGCLPSSLPPEDADQHGRKSADIVN